MMSATALCRTCGSIRAAATAVLNHWKGPPRGYSRTTVGLHRLQFQTVVTGSDVRWMNSGVTMRATEGEIRLTELIKEKLDPTYLSVEDVSCGCGTKYTIHIDSEQFRGKRPLQQHKLVNEAIGDEMKNIHSVSIRIGGPDD